MSEKKRIKILLGINSLTETQYPAYSNHIQVCYRYGRSYPDIDFTLWNPSRMSIDRMRNQAGKIALENELDYILFHDDDVLVPMDGLRKLLACDADIAGGKAVIRGYPFDWMVFEKVGEGLRTYKELSTEGVIDVAALGFCYTLIKTSVLKDMRAPYFVTGPNFTEDIYFCMKAKEANPETTIKVDCSVDLGHILWPEVMGATNRDAYKRYFEETNPGVLESLEKQPVDRGEAYLKLVKEAVGA